MSTPISTDITPDTTFYTYTGQFAGYTLEESILGNQTVGEYARNTAADPRSDEDQIEDLTGWLVEQVRTGSGFWLSEQDAESDDNRPPRYADTLVAFTPRDIHDRILALAAEEGVE